MEKYTEYDQCSANMTLHYVDFEVPEGQGLGKIVKVCMTDTISEPRCSEEGEIHYQAPEVHGVSISEGVTDDTRTLFIRGTNFGKSAEHGVVRVSQHRPNFLPNPPQMPVHRIGGTREMIARSCK